VKRATIDLALKLTRKILLVESALGECVILKLTDQHEVGVLRRLHDNKSTEQTRIIPLLDVLNGRILVLPLRTPLLHFLDLDASVDDVGELALQFLEGVTYLQHSSVAHLDLKPDNIVVQRDPESKKVDLTIIDFNIAVYADAEPILFSSSGTPEWCAPEVSAGTAYDPLLADRWSCGRVLTLFTERMRQGRLWERMCLLSQQLMDPDPSLRPPLPNLRLQEMGGVANSPIRHPLLNLRNLPPQGMYGKPNPSIRLPTSGPGGPRRPRRGKPRSSRRPKEPGLKSSLFVKT